MRQIHLSILILMTGLLFAQCSKTETDEQIVASFGPHQITLDEFRIGYLKVMKQPDAVDSKETRQAYLDELINRRLLSAKAKESGLDRDERILLRLDAYRNKCLREMHYEKVIEPQVEYDEKLVRETYQFTKDQSRIKHLFFKTRARADSAQRLLKDDLEKFADLSKVVFADSGLAQSGGDLGWVNWDQMEYDMAMAAFRQELNVISNPIRTSYGYHLIMVVDRKRSLIISEQEFQQQRKYTEFLLRSKIGDKIAYDYVGKMMARVEIKIEPKALKFVEERLQNILNRPPSQYDNLSEFQLKEKEAEEIEESIWEKRNESIIHLDGKTITIGQFAAALVYVPYYALRTNVKTILDYAIRDFQLTKEAKQMGLAESSTNAGYKATLFEDFILEKAIRRRIIKNIKITDRELRQKYDDLKATGKVGQSFAADSAFVYQVLFRQRWKSEVPNYLQNLKQGMDIEKRPEIIHAYYDRLLGQTKKLKDLSN